VSNGFQGAIVISSSRRVAAISNILANPPDNVAAGSYVGSSAGATTLSLPLLNKNNSGYDTWYSIQNAGTGIASVTVDYSSGAPDAVFTIPVGAAKVVYQAQEAHEPVAVFAATVTSDQPVVAAVIQENKELFAYTGFTNPSPDPVFPIINANNAGYQTGLQIQNAGDTATSVTVSYTPAAGTGNGTACTETQSIEPGDSATFALAAFHPSAPVPNGGTSDCAKGLRFVGSAQVTANTASQNLVGIGNQLKLGVNGEAYGAFNKASATAKVVMPLIMDRNSGFFTGFNLQNVGDVATNVECVFTNTTYKVGPTNLAPGGVLNELQNGKIPDAELPANGRYVGGGTCTADNASAKIVAIVNQLGAAADKDQLLVYEGANP
jgi:hypothetical protein